MLVGPPAFSSWRWWVAAAVLALTAVVCLALWAEQSRPASVAPPRTSIDDAALTRSGPALAADPTSVHLARPVALRIPSIDVATRLTRLGLQEDRTVEVPSNPDVAGWFRRGPPPGAPGSSVILGHVDSTAGPAVFYRLREMKQGDRMAVSLDNGTTVWFEVHSVRTYTNNDFPAQRVYGRQGSSELNLVTCGGDYDSTLGGYQSNLVVNARPLPQRRAPAPSAD